MNIFFDLDGTLIDSRQRLYRLFQHLVTLSALSFDDYWDLKRNKISHKKILSTHFNFSDFEILQFEQKWLTLIETDEWLLFDKPYDGVTEYLQRISQLHNLYIITDRQFKSKVSEQIKGLGWQNFFKQLLVTEQKREKFELIAANKDIKLSPYDLLVGDTGKDIQTGKRLGIKTVGVLSGFLNKNAIIEYAPDIIIENITNLKIGTDE